MSLQVPDSCYSVSFYSLVLSCNNDRHLQPLLKLWGAHWGLCSREKILTHLLVSSMLITLWQTIKQYTIRWDNHSLCIDTLYFSFLCTYLIWKHCCSRSTIKKQNKNPTCSWALFSSSMKTMKSSSCFVAAFTFCQQVTPQEYEDQREATTLESLKQLLHDISSSKRMSAKEKRRMLKEFEKHHPVVFLQHFSSTFWNTQVAGTGLTSWVYLQIHVVSGF